MEKTISIDALTNEIINRKFYTAYYQYINQVYSVNVSNLKVIDYLEKFIGSYKETEPGKKELIKIYVLNDFPAKVLDGYLDNAKKISIHYGKGNRWNMKGYVVTHQGWRIVKSINTGTIFLLNNNLNIGIVIGSMERELPEDTFHLIRSIMARAAEQNGFNIFHAASVYYKNKGIMIVGESGQGKTTTFLELIKHGAHPISNDRVFISDNKDLKMYSWPSFINIAVGTMSKYPKLRNFTPNLGKQDLIELWKSKIKTPLEPPQFKEIFKKDFLTSGKIDFIIFPELSPYEKQSSLIELSSIQVKRLLQLSNYSPYDPAYFNWHKYINIDSKRVNALSTLIINRLVEKVPAYQLKGGESLETAISNLNSIINRGEETR